MEKNSFFPRVLIVSSECSPLSKTGGLADVAGALPGSPGRELADIRIITPYHRSAKEKFSSMARRIGGIFAPMGGRNESAGIFRLETGGNIYYLIESEKYFSENIYMGGEAEGEQYAFFCKAVLAALQKIDFEPDILHLNDWHTGMIPWLISENFAGSASKNLKTLITIHNLAFKGVYLLSFFEKFFGITQAEESLKMYGDCGSFLKSGILRSDLVNTVSPSYAAEIREKEYGMDLDAELRSLGPRLRGILNGIDYSVWNPENPVIPAPFGRESLFLKLENKKALLSECGLSQTPETPLLGIVGRMTEQKGYGLILERADELIKLNAPLIVLGSGDPKLEAGFMRLAELYPDRVFFKSGYDEGLARRIYAASDIFLMPSSFEPCGLAQMIAMRYGSLPLVRRTGGLKDSVKGYDEFGETATGFAFNDLSSAEFFATLTAAVGLYSERELWKRLQSNAMSEDFGLGKMGSEYLKLYCELMSSGEKSR